MTVRLVEHPLAQHLVTQLRDISTEPARFRTITDRLTVILALEATSDLALRVAPIQTPLEAMDGKALAHSLVVVPVLRAGMGMLAAIVELFPDIAVGYIGLERDHATAVASTYYCKLPTLTDRAVLIVDPMLATGGSACRAIDAVKAAGGANVRLVCIVAAPEGIAAVHEAHPDVPIIVSAIDRELDDRKYILPGLGDFGDRLYSTH